MKYNFEINIVHYKKLKERKEFISDKLNGKKINYKFIDLYDRDTLSEKELSKFTNDINNAYKANFLSHIECFNNLINSKYDLMLILEDDSMLKEKFYTKIEKYLKQLPKNFDLFYISDGKSNFKIPIYKKLPFKNVYKKDNKYTEWGGHGATKFADGYFISKKCAELFVEKFFSNSYKVDTSIDWWKNEMIDKYNLNVYWGEPTLISTNNFESSFSGQFGQGKV